ncbi:MAG: ribonuclease P protein component [Commensalibacter sp.]
MNELDGELETSNRDLSPLRLKKRPQFLNVAAKGKKIPMPGLVLQILHRCDEDVGRVGFTVTKKVGNSVIRNRVRRRLKAVFHETAKMISFKGYDLVLIGREKTCHRAFKDILNDFNRALNKAGIIKSDK